MIKNIQQETISNKFILPILMMVTAVTIMSTDLYVPSLPDLAGYFSTSAEIVTLTISLNVLAFGFAQLVHGPLADRYGRRPILLIGMFAFFLSSFACAFAQSIETLILFRILQGISGAVEAVVVVAIIRDVYEEDEGVKVFALYGIIVAIAPAIAPIIGGYLHVYFAWQANFILVGGLIGLVGILIYRYLPETTTPNIAGFKLNIIIKSYMQLLLNRRFVSYTLTLSIIFAGLWAFIATGSFVLIDSMGVATEHYGYYQLAIVLAFSFGSTIANRLAGKIDSEWLLLAGLCTTFIGGLSLCILSWFDWITPLTLTIGMGIYLAGCGPMFAVVPLKALNTIDNDNGTGSSAALLNAFQILVGSSGAFVAGMVYNGTAKPTIYTILACSTLAILVYLVFRPWKENIS